jgi:hypothetical protein
MFAESFCIKRLNNKCTLLPYLLVENLNLKKLSQNIYGQAVAIFRIN